MNPGAENERGSTPARQHAAAVERLFLESIELKPDQRRAHVLARCGADASLAEDVLGLLAHAEDEATDGFLSSRVAPGRGLMTELGAKTLVGRAPARVSEAESAVDVLRRAVRSTQEHARHGEDEEPRLV